MHILVVDDNDEICSLFAFAFSVEGHTTACASDGQEAMRMVEQGGFDALVMDINMPDMDGIEATHCIRVIPHGQQLTIVLVTGTTDATAHRAALAAGASAVILKPALPSEVLARIEACRQQAPA